MTLRTATVPAGCLYFFSPGAVCCFPEPRISRSLMHARPTSRRSNPPESFPCSIFSVGVGVILDSSNKVCKRWKCPPVSLNSSSRSRSAAIFFQAPACSSTEPSRRSSDVQSTVNWRASSESSGKVEVRDVTPLTPRAGTARRRQLSRGRSLASSASTHELDGRERIAAAVEQFAQFKKNGTARRETGLIQVRARRRKRCCVSKTTIASPGK